MIESLVTTDDAFNHAAAKTMVTDALEFYRGFLDEHGYAFKCHTLDILIDRVNKADTRG